MILRLWCIPFTAFAVFGVSIDYPRIYWGGLAALMLILSIFIDDYDQRSKDGER